MKMTSKAALLAAVTGVVFAAQTTGAFAQRSLFDILFGDQPRYDRRGATLEGPVNGAPVGNGARARAGAIKAPADFDGSDPDPLPTVKRSQYFTYKPEAERLGQRARLLRSHRDGLRVDRHVRAAVGAGHGVRARRRQRRDRNGILLRQGRQLSLDHQ